MSVEASLIMPFVFLIIIFLMYVGFYMYDDCLIVQDNARIAIRLGQIKWVSDERVLAEFRNIENDWYYDKYVSFIKGERKVNLSNDKIVLSQGASLRTPAILPFGSGENSWPMGDEVSAERRDIVRILRDLRKVRNNGRIKVQQNNG